MIFVRMCVYVEFAKRHQRSSKKKSNAEETGKTVDDNFVELW